MIKGDLTDSKTDDMFGSKQFEDEWITYNKIIKEHISLNTTIWLDVRGNHGNDLVKTKI